MTSAEYDREADAVYVWLGDPRESAETAEVDAYRSVDLDEKGAVVGVEILGLKHYVIDDIAQTYGFLESVPDINWAVSLAVASEVQPRLVVETQASVLAGPAPSPSQGNRRPLEVG